MDQTQSRETAWRVVEEVWDRRRSASESPAVNAIDSENLSILFDLFWKHQFDDDRTEVRNEISQLVDLLLGDAGTDAD